VWLQLQRIRLYVLVMTTHSSAFAIGTLDRFAEGLFKPPLTLPSPPEGERGVGRRPQQLCICGTVDADANCGSAPQANAAIAWGSASVSRFDHRIDRVRQPTAML